MRKEQTRKTRDIKIERNENSREREKREREE